ncbi:hypothetical protein EYF80_021859 [Liparis tanakae]|uniref:Uncharacterized protein n=1 Tax=Liparis tanakae TaxID=230148 RepID=A0A4Z2HQH8_9TELE|nr:hypothetical protein EYF80_021859 [Liparis tanakae]
MLKEVTVIAEAELHTSRCSAGSVHEVPLYSDSEIVSSVMSRFDSSNARLSHSYRAVNIPSPSAAALMVLGNYDHEVHPARREHVMRQMDLLHSFGEARGRGGHDVNAGGEEAPVLSVFSWFK